MSIQALGDRVVIKKKDESTTTSSGIIIAGESKERTATGEVVFIGEGRLTSNGETIPLIVNVDNEVLYPRGVGIEIKIDDIEYIVLHETDIIGIIT